MTSAQRLRDLDADRRRVLDIGTRSRALLELAADKIEKMEGRAPPLLDDLERTAKYQTFHRSIGVVRLMASGRSVYDEGTLMGPVAVTDDPRLTAIAELAALAAVATERLDVHTRDLAGSEDRGLELCAEFMAGLPKPRRRDVPPPVDRRPRARHERARAWALSQVATETWALVGSMPERSSHADRIEWETALLTDTDEPAPALLMGVG